MSDQEVAQLAELLKKLEPGFMPYPILEQIARIAALPILELVPLRLNASGKVEVLLIDRGPDDPIWPNMLHTPGTVIRATDLSQPQNQAAFERITQDELGGVAMGQPHSMGTMLHKSKRGVEQALLYWAEVLGEQNVGTFYAVDQLPDTLIDSQAEFIQQAATAFAL